MKKLNDLFLSVTVAIIDFLYRDLPIERFWVLETIARAPYFAFVSVLHLKESLGLRDAFSLIIWFSSIIGFWWVIILMLPFLLIT